jgi:hypothetical protein
MVVAAEIVSVGVKVRREVITVQNAAMEVAVVIAWGGAKVPLGEVMALRAVMAVAGEIVWAVAKVLPLVIIGSFLR